MRFYTITLDSGVTRRVRAANRVEAIREANRLYPNRVRVVELAPGEDRPTEAFQADELSQRPDAQAISDQVSDVTVTPRVVLPTPVLSDADRENVFVSLAPPPLPGGGDTDNNEELLKEQEQIVNDLAAINEQVANAVNTGFLPSQPVNPLLPQLDLAEVDPGAAFIRQLGLTSRPLTDPYRRRLTEQSFDFFNPFRFGNLLQGGQFFDVQDRSAPGFDDYLAVVQNPLQARQSAANIFDQIVSGVRDSSFTPGTTASILGDVLGARARTTPFGLAQEADSGILQGFANLGRQALQNRVGTAAFNLIQSQLPSVEDLYTDYFTRSRAGEDVAPTFAETLQGAFGLGGR
jgi:hypothetical protein